MLAYAINKTLFSRGAARIADWSGKELYSGAGVNRLWKTQNLGGVSGISSPE